MNDVEVFGGDGAGVGIDDEIANGFDRAFVNGVDQEFGHGEVVCGDLFEGGRRVGLFDDRAEGLAFGLGKLCEKGCPFGGWRCRVFGWEFSAEEFEFLIEGVFLLAAIEDLHFEVSQFFVEGRDLGLELVDCAL